MPTDEEFEAAKQTCRQVAVILSTLPGDELRMFVLCVCIRTLAKSAAKRMDKPFDDVLQFMIRRVAPAKSAQPSLLSSVDAIVRDYPDCRAVALLVVGGAGEGGCHAVTSKSTSVPQDEDFLVQALRGLADGIERGQEGGNVDVNLKQNEPLQ